MVNQIRRRPPFDLRRLAIALFSLLVALVPTNAGFAEPDKTGQSDSERIGVTDNEITIGSCSPQTGILSERGQQLVIGANSYFESANEKGGINGRKIKLIVCDDKYEPETAINCFNTCLKDKVFAAGFLVGSPPISKYVRMGEVNKLPLFGFCTGTPVVYDHFSSRFVVRPGYHDEVVHHVDELWNLGIRKIAVVYQGDAFGAAIRENVLKELKRYNAAPIVEASYSRKSQDIDDAYARVRDAKPEAVILGATTDAFKGFIKKRAEQNWNVLLAGFSTAADYVPELGKAADGVVLTQVVPPLDDKLPIMQQYNKARKKFFPKAEPNATALEAFENAMVVTEALKRAGHDLTRQKFIAAMESIRDFDLGAGPNFKVSYSSANHNGLTARAVYFAISKDGKLTPLSSGDWKHLVNAAKEPK